MNMKRICMALWAVATTFLLGSAPTAFDKHGVTVNVSAEDQNGTGNHI